MGADEPTSLLVSRRVRLNSDDSSVTCDTSVPLNVALEVACTEAEGPGRRYALWVQGCPLRCPGCCNPEFLAFTPRSQRRVEDVVAAIDAARSRGIEGISVLGGEPTRQAAGLALVAEATRAMGLSVMVYSGFTLAQLRSEGDADVDRLLAATDLLVDGPYLEAQRTTERRFIGSTNQVLHALSDRYRVDDPAFSTHNTVEVRLVTNNNGSSHLIVNGWPTLGARTR
jgi:anaerobic ribonucleoside-triphosphate reductase activating protein